MTMTETNALYETDELRWIEVMSDAILERRWNDVDVEHLAEDMEIHAWKNRCQIKSQLVLLMWWQLAYGSTPTLSQRPVLETQRRIVANLGKDETLREHALEKYEQCYQLAHRKVPSTPANCPWTWDELLTPLSQRCFSEVDDRTGANTIEIGVEV